MWDEELDELLDDGIDPDDDAIEIDDGNSDIDEDDIDSIDGYGLKEDPTKYDDGDYEFEE